MQLYSLWITKTFREPLILSFKFFHSDQSLIVAVFSLTSQKFTREPVDLIPWQEPIREATSRHGKIRR